MTPVEVSRVTAPNLGDPLRLLESSLREGEPLPEGFVGDLRRLLEYGDLEVLAARLDGETVGVLVLLFRPNVSLGAPFSSIEDLYVHPGERRRGAGSALLRAAEERCKDRGVSYLEAQVEEGGADRFYAALGYEPEPGVRVFSRSLPLGNAEDEKADN